MVVAYDKLNFTNISVSNAKKIEFKLNLFFNCFPFRNYCVITRNKIALAEATIARNSAHGIPIGKLIFHYQSKPTQLLKTKLRTFPSTSSLPSSPIKINPGVPELWSTSKQTTKNLIFIEDLCPNWSRV